MQNFFYQTPTPNLVSGFYWGHHPSMRLQNEVLRLEQEVTRPKARLPITAQFDQYGSYVSICILFLNRTQDCLSSNKGGNVPIKILFKIIFFETLSATLFYRARASITPGTQSSSRAPGGFWIAPGVRARRTPTASTSRSSSTSISSSQIRTS